VSIGVWLKRGSRNETERNNGISHFLEHLVFKGTEGRSAREIALAMDEVGGQMDALTSKEYTCFYAKVLDQHVRVAVELLADIVQRPAFDPVEVERERQVVLEEIRMVEDSPDELIYDLFSSHIYDGHPLGRPIQGTMESVGRLKRRQLLDYFRNAYRPANLMIVAAGNLKHDAMVRLVRRTFGGLAPGRPVNGRISPPRARPGLVTRAKRGLEQLHLLLGVPAFPGGLAERYPLFVLNAILGGTLSSRLFQKIREERGLVYSVYSAVNAFLDSGFLTIYAAMQPAAALEVVDLIRGELIELRDEGPGEEELRVAKEHLKGSLMLALESTSSRMSNLARQEIYHGRQLTLEETLEGVDGVSAEAVRSVARDLLGDRELAMAAVGRIGRFRPRDEVLRL